MHQTIKGKVVSINATKNYFTIKEDKTGKNLDIKTWGIDDLPKNYYDNIVTNLNPDDVIICATDDTNHLLEDPFVTTIVHDFTSVVTSMIRAVRFKGKLLVPIPILEEICKHAITIGDKLEYGEELSSLSSEFSLGVRTELARIFLDGYKGRVNLTQDHVIKFFSMWNFKNDLRLLEVLGLNQDSVSKMYMTPFNLYNRLLTDPLSVHSIDSPLALHIAKITDVEYTKDQLKVGTLLRKLARETLGSGNMYVCASDFSTRHKIPSKLFNLLSKQHTVYVSNKSTSYLPKDSLYIKELVNIEKAVAGRLAVFMLSAIKPIPYIVNPEDSNLTKDDQQNRAVNMALTKVVSVITGPAGTGKTTIVKKILYCLKDADVKVCCTSFTGQATARIETCTGTECANMDTMIAHREEYSFNYLILDEASMVDINLLYRFLCAFPGPYRVLLIGDVNQLSPIGPGRVLEQLITSQTIPVTILNTIHRVKNIEGKANCIIENSQRIASWGTERFEFKTGDDFEVVEGDQDTLVDEIYSMQKKGLTLDDFVIITPFKKFLPDITRIIQKAYNHDKPFIAQIPGVGWKAYSRLTTQLDEQISSYDKCLMFHEQDRVIIRENHSKVLSQSGETVKTYNGQEGIVISVSMDGILVRTVKCGKTIDIMFPLKSKKEGSETGETLTSHSVYSLELSNAVTVHRIQGGQKKVVVYWIDKFDTKTQEKFVTKSITYTAITRASEKVLIINLADSASKSIVNVTSPKYDSLSLCLKSMLPQEYILEQDDLMKKEIEERTRQLEAKYIEEFGELPCDEDYDEDDY
jgi:hypothetical protein